MKTEKNKKIGVVIMFLGIVVSFLLMNTFHLFGAKLDLRNLSLLTEMILATAVLPLALYLGLLFYSGKKLALQIGGGAAVFLAAAYILGFLLH